MLEATPSNGGLRVEAPAKVNLTLRVLGRRRDGFHDLESVVAAVDLFDRLEVRPAEDLALESRGLAVPAGEDNLVMQAAHLLAEETGARCGVRISLRKRIPLGRGLGGGSADAAATLVALNALWETNLSRGNLARLGASLGSDVPFFLGAPLAVMRGRGERIEPVPARVRWWLALAWPDFPMPTADVYAALDRLGPSPDGRPEATAILGALGGPAGEAEAFLVNDLERAARCVRPEAMDFRAMWQQAGAGPVGMTGSGSAYFALADTEGQARRYRDAARAAGAEATVVRPLRESGHEETPR